MAVVETSIHAPHRAPISRPETSRAIRADIQALRGVAVLLVLLYHATGGVAGGYLGVDVFFVISGFLMTNLIGAGIERGGFTLSAFYFRRAKRLLPAAYATFFAVALLSPLFLTWSALLVFAKEMIGAVTFTANIVMWRHTGYFDGAAELKPLLHIWSLSLEEQYYLVLPATLVFVPRRHWMKVATGLLVLSGIACAVAAVRSPGLAFYWLPFRAWELGLGSLGSLWVRRDADRLRSLARPLFWPALLALVAIPFHPVSRLHPGPDALIVCLSTLAIIGSDRAELWQNPPARALASLGDVSYSVYLVHWPIFAFAANAWVGPGDGLPLTLRIGGLLLSLVLGYASYRLVEVPTRRSAIRPSARLAFGLAAASALLVAIPAVTARVRQGHTDDAAMLAFDRGFGDRCNFDDALRPGPKCQSAESPAIMVWGDSYAMQLVSGIDATSHGAGVVQATKGVCGPLLGVAPVSNDVAAPYNHGWAVRCLAFNRSVVDYLRTHPSIKTVVLSSPLRQYLERAQGDIVLGDNTPLVPVSSAAALEGLRRTVDTVRALGKRVVFAAPPPSMGADVGLCLERRAQGKLRLGAAADCSIAVRDYHDSRAAVLNLLDSAARRVDLPVFRFDPFLCDAKRCVTQIGSTFLYADQGHLSRAGARLIADRLSLADSLVRTAR